MFYEIILCRYDSDLWKITYKSLQEAKLQRKWSFHQQTCRCFINWWVSHFVLFNSFSQCVFFSCRLGETHSFGSFSPAVLLLKWLNNGCSNCDSQRAFNAFNIIHPVTQTPSCLAAAMHSGPFFWSIQLLKLLEICRYDVTSILFIHRTNTALIHSSSVKYYWGRFSPPSDHKNVFFCSLWTLFGNIFNLMGKEMKHLLFRFCDEIIFFFFFLQKIIMSFIYSYELQLVMLRFWCLFEVLWVICFNNWLCLFVSG